MKVIKNIDTPKEWEMTNDWDSHRPMLWLSLQKIPYIKFYEFGMGNGSTSLLKKHCSFLASIEENEEWRGKFIFGYRKIILDDGKKNYDVYQKYNHMIFKEATFILNRLVNPNIYHEESIYFVDNAPAENRKVVIEAINKRFENTTEGKSVIIIHDTEESADYVYHLKEILNTFKYRLDFRPEGMPATTAVSNFINVEEWV